MPVLHLPIYKMKISAIRLAADRKWVALGCSYSLALQHGPPGGLVALQRRTGKDPKECMDVWGREISPGSQSSVQRLGSRSLLSKPREPKSLGALPFPFHRNLWRPQCPLLLLGARVGGRTWFVATENCCLQGVWLAPFLRITVTF